MFNEGFVYIMANTIFFSMLTVSLEHTMMSISNIIKVLWDISDWCHIPFLASDHLRGHLVYYNILSCQLFGQFITLSLCFTFIFHIILFHVHPECKLK